MAQYRRRGTERHQAMAQYRCSGEWFAVPPFACHLIQQAITRQEPVFEKPTIWADLWRMERDGNRYRWRLRFASQRCSRSGGDLTPGILRLLRRTPGKGRHAESREKAELLRNRSTYLASLPTLEREQTPGLRELEQWP